jgi:hypothetical protein
MTLKPSRLIPLAAAVFLLAGWTLWAFASDRIPGRVVAGLWAVALIIALGPLVLSLVDRATTRKRPRGSSRQ